MRSGGMSGRIGSTAGSGAGGLDPLHDGCGGSGAGSGTGVGGDGSGGTGRGGAGFILRTSGSYGDTRCLLDGDYYG